MRFFWLSLFSLAILMFFGLAEIIFLKYLNKAWWKIRSIRVISYICPLTGTIGIAIWVLGILNENIRVGMIGATLAVGTVTILMGLFLTLPISGIINSVQHWLEKRADLKRKISNPETNDERRQFIKGAAAIFPLIGIGAGGSGVAHAFGSTDMPRIKMKYANLPKQLDGFKMLLLSDSHLGIYKTLDDIEDIMIQAESQKPDLILYTGDISDDLKILPDVLKLIGQSKAPYGFFASLGNHEYYRGISEVIRAFDRGPVPLLRGSGAELNIRGASLYLAGADDPRYMRRDNSGFLRQTITDALEGSPPDAFKILMSHRPEGFDEAAYLGIDLTLSGHTHGGQVGFDGRSFWEPFMPERYLWGKYEKGPSQMYLTSGIGHWFPFRLGCPTEAPLIELASK